jgi:hypothetical protein
MVIAIISESRSASVRNRDRHHLGTLIAIARNTQAFEAGKPAMIIDAKYSDTEQPAAGDLYQLLCYVRRLKADIGVLVYLSSQSTWHSMVGRAEGNVAIAAGGASTHKTSQGLLQVSGAVCTDYEAAISKA